MPEHNDLHMDYMLYPKGHGFAASIGDGATGPNSGSHGHERNASKIAETTATTLPFPCDKAEVQAWEDRLNRLPIITRLGARFDLGDPCVVQVHIDEVQPYHLGGMGVSALNGSILSSIVDCAIGASGVIHFSGVRAGTLSFTLNFLKPVFGRRATAQCVVTRRTDTLLFTEARVLDQRGRLCVTAIGIASRVASPRRTAVTEGVRKVAVTEVR